MILGEDYSHWNSPNWPGWAASYPRLFWIYGLFDGNNCLYIGRTTNPSKRFKQHQGAKCKSTLSLFSSNRTPRMVLLAIFDKDDPTNWEDKFIHGYKELGHPIVNLIYPNDLNKYLSVRARMENSRQFWTKLTDKEYHLICEKMSKAHLGKKLGPRSIEIRRRISSTLSGRSFSAERRKNISISITGASNPNYGRPRPEKTRMRISSALKGNPKVIAAQQFRRERERIAG